MNRYNQFGVEGKNKGLENMSKNVAVKVLALFIVGVLGGCVTSPTGRTQFLMVDDASLAPQAAESFADMQEKELVSQNKSAQRYVQCVVRPLIDEAKGRYSYLPDNWDVVVFDNEVVNAFAMPGGKVGVFTGMIDLAENQHQLAAVVGHEIGHVVAQHSAERMSTAQATVLGLTLAGMATANNSEQAIIMAALGLGAQYGIQLPFSRTHEKEADQIGQELMALAGFDPAEAVSLWQLMDESAEARPPEMLSTHPAPDNRAEILKKLLVTTEPLYREAKSMGKAPHCRLPKKPTTTNAGK